MIHDFNTGLQYIVSERTGKFLLHIGSSFNLKDERTSSCIVDCNNNILWLSGNCSVTPITPDYSDAARLDGRRVRIKHAKELLQVNPSQFVFSGKVLDAKSKQYLQPLETNLFIKLNFISFSRRKTLDE